MLFSVGIRPKGRQWLGTYFCHEGWNADRPALHVHAVSSNPREHVNTGPLARIGDKH